MAKDKPAKAAVPDEFEIRVRVKRDVMLATFDEATRIGRSSIDVIRDRIERPVLTLIKATLEDYSTSPSGVRPKKRDYLVWRSQAEKLIVRMPLALKCEVLRVVRENSLTQSDFGEAIVEAALRDPAWLAKVLAAAAVDRLAREQQDGELRRGFFGERA